MITKKDIELGFKFWKNHGRLSTFNYKQIKVYTPEEYAAKAGTTVKVAYENYGAFGFLIYKLDDTSYLGIDADITEDELDEIIYDFLLENGLI